MNQEYIKTRATRISALPTTIDRSRLVDFFRQNNQLDYTVAEIARSLGYKYNSIKYHIQNMVFSGELVQVREMGNGWTYQLSEWFNFHRREEVKRH